MFLLKNFIDKISNDATGWFKWGIQVGFGGAETVVIKNLHEAQIQKISQKISPIRLSQTQACPTSCNQAYNKD